MNKIKFLLVLVLIPLWVNYVLSQRVEITEVFPETYPTILLEFKVWDKDGKEVRDFSSSDFTVLENSISRAIQSVMCPPVGQTKFSLILTIDISQSMSEPSTIPGKTKMDVVRQAARNAIKSLPADSSRWEAAITLFDYENVLVRNFTNSKWWLNKGLDTALLAPRGGTDYNAGFLYDWLGNPGALLVARNAKYKPVVIFLTDGKHEGRSTPPPSRVNVWVSQILDSARKYDVTIYAITLGFDVPTELNNICSGTPYGQAYQSVPSEEELGNLYSNILNTIGTIGPPAPCRIKFTSDCDGGNVELVYKPFAVSDTFTYKVPGAFLPALDVVERNISFTNQSTPYEVSVKIKARNNFVMVNPPGVTSPFNNVSVVDWGGAPPPFKLEKDSSRNVKLAISPFPDSAYHNFTFDFVTSACDGNRLSVQTGWIYPLDVDCGSGIVGQTKNLPQKTIFCNNWVEPLTIYSISISGGDQGDFKILGGTTNITVQPQSCLKFDISFTPSDASDRSSKIVFNTNKGRFESKIFGSGSGFPEISTIKSIEFDTIDCKRTSIDTTIKIRNTGALNLEISKFEFTGANPTEFSFVPSNPGAVSIPPSGEYSLTIKCSPVAKGLLSADLVITSNAKNSPSYTIPLKVFSADRSFKANIDKLDFGVICPGEEKVLDVQVQNTGNVALNLDLNTSAPYSIQSAVPISVPASSTQTVKVVLNSANEGTFDGELKTIDSYCQTVQTVTLHGVVLSPKIDRQPIVVFGVVGVPKDTVISIKNVSNRQLTISNAVFTDPQVTILSPNLPWNIPAMSSISVSIRYLAQTSDALNAYLRLTGQPCDFNDSIFVTSNPVASRADIVIEKHSGLIGEIVTIPVLIKNGIMLDKSGTTKVRTKINYDQSLLKFVSVTPNVTTNLGSNSISFDNVPITPTTNVLLQISFEVLNSSVTQTTLDINSTSAIDGFINFTEIDGSFEVLPSTAEISVGNVEANTGEEFLLPIYLKNVKNVTDFHQSISTEISFNYTLMEPIGSTPKGTIEDGRTKIVINNLPLKPINSDSAIALLNFRAKLGNDTSTSVAIRNTRTAKGFVVFKETNGSFSLKNVCKSGGLRLFEPQPGPIFMVTTNPSENSIDVVFEPLELGIHKITLTDIFGNIIFSTEYEFSSPSQQEFRVYNNILSDGVYFVRVEGPTTVRSKKVFWVK